MKAKNIFIGLLSLLSVILVYFCFFHQGPVRNNLNNRDQQNVYYLQAIKYNSTADQSLYQLPYNLRVSPLSKGYKGEIEKEDKLLSDKQEPMSFISKRIAELIRWGEDIKITGKKEIAGNEISWESCLQRYSKLIDRQFDYIKSQDIPDADKNEILSQFTTVFNYHWQILNRVVSGLKKSENEKQYLLSVIGNILNGKVGYINSIVPKVNPYRVQYSLKPVYKEGNWGNFKILISSPDINDKYDNLKISFNGQTPDNNEINIKNGNEQLYVDFPKIDILSDQKWQEKIINASGQQYQYEILIPLVNNANEYFLSVNNDFDFSVFVSIDQMFFDPLSNTEKSNKALNKEFASHYNLNEFHDRVVLKNDFISTYKLSVLTNKRLTSVDLEKLNIQLVPYFALNLKLVKQNGQEKKVLTVGDNNESSKKTYKILLALDLIAIIALLFKDKIIKRIDLVRKNRTISNYVDNIIKILYKFRWINVITGGVIVLTSLGWEKNYSDIYYLWGTAFLLFGTVGMKTDPMINYFIFFVLYLSFSFFVIIGFKNGAEWLAGWAYIFLGISVFYSILTVNKTVKQKYDNIFLNKFITLLKKRLSN